MYENVHMVNSIICYALSIQEHYVLDDMSQIEHRKTYFHESHRLLKYWAQH